MFQELYARIARVLSPEDHAAPAAGESEAPVQMEALRAEVDLEAQRTLDQIDDALTAWQQLEQRLERERSGVALWERKAAQAAAEASKQPEGSDAYSTWDDLRAQAEAEAADRRQRVKILADVLEQARPTVEEALHLVEAIGFSRERALSQIDRLELTQATVAVKERLASARLSGETSRIEDLLRAATERVDAASAEASAKQELADFINPEVNRIAIL
jgi:DNA repair exonuclease SbcCD ATPase subunit